VLKNGFIMKYILKKYDKNIDFLGEEMICTLDFDVYFFRWKVGSKMVYVSLSNFVTWRDFFNFWDKCIEDNSVFTKKAFERTFF
jgi:hypothetical protein